MRPINLLIALIVIIIIIGGVIIIIIGRGPIPEPQCIVCGTRLIKNLGIAEVILGIGALITATRIQKGMR